MVGICHGARIRHRFPITAGPPPTAPVRAESRRDAGNNLLFAMACHGLGDDTAAGEALGKALAVNRADPWAVDLARELAGGG